MPQFNVARLFDYFASGSPKRARARAEHLSEAAPERALALFAAAAEAGDPEAAFMVGERFLEGKGTLRQPFEAARWYLRAAHAGHVRAQCRLAQLHLFGLPKAAAGQDNGLFDPVATGGADFHAALFWAQPAAAAGSAEAQAMLGHVMTYGPEELRDHSAALSWYRKSAEQDCPQGRLGHALALMRNSDAEESTSVARDELLRAAEAGLPTAHYLLGVFAESPDGRTPDDTTARQHYRIAAEAGLGTAQARLGVLLFEGRGGPPDLLNGETWLRRAALSGDADAAALLGDIHARGGALPPNYAEAAEWFRMAADRGHRSAARALGMLYLTGAGVARDPDEAAIWFKQAAEAGDPAAQTDLATLLQTGAVSSLAHDPPPVHEWFERAAEQGDLIGAFNYAVCLAEGVGVARNDARAVVWLRRAAAGLANAQYWYGRMIADGRGVAKDDAEAALWFARAAQAGVAEAQVALADALVNGRGVPHDPPMAKSWLLHAADTGHADAMFALGALHDGGQTGIAVDPAEARRWFAEAAEHGHPTAALMLGGDEAHTPGVPEDGEAGAAGYGETEADGGELADVTPGGVS